MRPPITVQVQCANALKGLPDCIVKFEVTQAPHLPTSRLCPVCRKWRDRELNNKRVARHRAKTKPSLAAQAVKLAVKITRHCRRRNK